MKKTRKSKKVKDIKQDYDCVRFLKSRGWKVFTGRFYAIEQGDLKYEFRLIFDFIGKKIV